MDIWAFMPAGQWVWEVFLPLLWNAGVEANFLKPDQTVPVEATLWVTLVHLCSADPTVAGRGEGRETQSKHVLCAWE